MGCGCLLVLAAMISPRLALFFVWLFSDRLSVAFSSFWLGLVGFLFLPWTALAWAVAYAPRTGVTGFGWFVVVFAFLVDLSTHSKGARMRAQRERSA